MNGSTVCAGIPISAERAFNDLLHDINSKTSNEIPPPRPPSGRPMTIYAVCLQYFYKRAGPSGASMLEAERAGLQAMHDAGAIRVPRPICGGDGPGGE